MRSRLRGAKRRPAGANWLGSSGRGAAVCPGQASSIPPDASSRANDGADLPSRLLDKNRRIDEATVVEISCFGPLLAIVPEDWQRRDVGAAQKILRVKQAPA